VVLSTGIGLKKAAGETVEADPAKGWLVKWEPVEKKAGNQGLAIIVDPGSFAKQSGDALNHLVITRPLSGTKAVWWAGFCWDKAGEITTPEAWKQHVASYASSLASPIKVTVAK
jgi:hypothetical protein